MSKEKAIEYLNNLTENNPIVAFDFDKIPICDVVQRHEAVKAVYIALGMDEQYEIDLLKEQLLNLCRKKLNHSTIKSIKIELNNLTVKNLKK